MFTDWVENHKGWMAVLRLYGKDGSSSILDLQLLWAPRLPLTLKQNWLILPTQRSTKQSAATAGQHKEKNTGMILKKLFADTDDKDVYSQHANALAILTNHRHGQ